MKETKNMFVATATAAETTKFHGNYTRAFTELYEYNLTEEAILLSMKAHDMNMLTRPVAVAATVVVPPLPLSLPPPVKFSAQFYPKEKDSLFWCFFILKHGEAEYQSFFHKNVLAEKKIKIQFVEMIQKEKQTIKQFKIASLTHLENNLANEACLDDKTFLTLCAIENINVLFVKNDTFFDLKMTDAPETAVVYCVNTNKMSNTSAYHHSSCKYGIEREPTPALLNEILTTKYKLDVIGKPMKSIAAYTLSDLKEICDKLSIPNVHNLTTNKLKSKKELYELIVQSF